MSFDGIVTNSIVTEFNDKLIGGRIDKVYQPEKDEILINIRNQGENLKLLISAASNNPRTYLTQGSKVNPPEPPMFCMLLRKHLIGGNILRIEQYKLDRIISIDISAIDELGEKSEKTLVVEIMGKHSNIIFMEKDSKKIIDSIKRVSFDMSRVRQIFPGNTYILPPNKEKSNPLTTTKEEFLALLKEEKVNTHIYKFFYFNYMGMSPLISKEICFDADIEIKRSLSSLSDNDIDFLYESFNKIMEKVRHKNFNPMFIRNNDQSILTFYALDLLMYGEENKHYMPTISEVLDKVYVSKDNFDRVIQKSQSINKSIQVKLDRTINKFSKQKNELIESKDREKYKIYADLISANIHNIGAGLKEISVPNFYDEEMKEITIPLDEKKSPPENAQRYYKRYSKLKSREKLLNIKIKETKQEIDYLENVLVSIDNSTTVEEIEEIRDELIEESYIRDTSKDRLRRKRKKKKTFKPYHYISKDGFDIYVGKNNVQNEYVTLKLARKDDIWLHVQGMPGSHVIIKKGNQDVPDSTLEEAATLAAYYSKAKNSANVSIDYTDKKYVRKTANSKPGMVIYDNFKTINITPSKAKIDSIKNIG